MMGLEKMSCDACAIGGNGCENPIYKIIIDGCGQNITDCKKAWESKK